MFRHDSPDILFCQGIPVSYQIADILTASHGAEKIPSIGFFLRKPILKRSGIAFLVLLKISRDYSGQVCFPGCFISGSCFPWYPAVFSSNVVALFISCDVGSRVSSFFCVSVSWKDPLCNITLGPFTNITRSWTDQVPCF